MPTEKICIIGAGSSGLAAAKALLEAGLPFDCFEKGSALGGNWRYDNGLSSACLVRLNVDSNKARALLGFSGGAFSLQMDLVRG